MDSRTINKIAVRYCFPIPQLNDLLDHISGKIIFYNEEWLPSDLDMA